MCGWLSLAFAQRLVDVRYGRRSRVKAMVNLGILDAFDYQGTKNQLYYIRNPHLTINEHS